MVLCPCGGSKRFAWSPGGKETAYTAKMSRAGPPKRRQMSLCAFFVRTAAVVPRLGSRRDAVTSLATSVLQNLAERHSVSIVEEDHQILCLTCGGDEVNFSIVV